MNNYQKMGSKAQKKSSNDCSNDLVSWKVVSSKPRGKVQQTTKTESKAASKSKSTVQFEVHLNHFFDVEPVPFDILVDVPSTNCINCLGPRHFKCDKPQSHDYCFNCGRSGVRVSTCPRCKRAYPAYYERRKVAGFGRQGGKNLENAAQKPKGPSIAKVPPPPTQAQVQSAMPTVRENFSWSSALKSSDVISNVPIENCCESMSSNTVISNSNEFSWYNNKIMESHRRFEITNDYVQDLTNLMEKIKNLSALDQNTIVLQFISERQKLLDKQEL